MTPRRDRGVPKNREGAGRPPLEQTRSFTKALSKLGPQGEAEVVQGLEEFEKDWAAGVSIGELYAKWDYKSLEVPKTCKQHDLRQIKPTYNTRLWMAPDPNQNRNMMLLLYVIRKSSRPEQSRVIKAMCDKLTQQKG